jgi:hypothetical protein
MFEKDLIEKTIPQPSCSHLPIRDINRDHEAWIEKGVQDLSQE